jgi:hypothetical protein
MVKCVESYNINTYTRASVDTEFHIDTKNPIPKFTLEATGPTRNKEAEL